MIFKHIGARLGRQIAVAGEPVGEARRTAVIGRRRQSEIAEALGEFGEQSGGLRNGLFRIERIGKATFVRRSRHELGDALGAGRADDARPETALLPDEPRQENDRQPVGVGGGLDQAADGFLDRLAGRMLRSGRKALLRGQSEAASARRERSSPAAKAALAAEMRQTGNNAGSPD